MGLLYWRNPGLRKRENAQRVRVERWAISKNIPRWTQESQKMAKCRKQTASFQERPFYSLGEWALKKKRKKEKLNKWLGQTFLTSVLPEPAYTNTLKCGIYYVYAGVHVHVYIVYIMMRLSIYKDLYCYLLISPSLPPPTVLRLDKLLGK